MADQPSRQTLAHCLPEWRKLGVINLEWLTQEDLQTEVVCVEIPDILAFLEDNPADIPTWEFTTRKGRARFIIRDALLFPEKIEVPGKGYVDHWSFFVDIQKDVSSGRVFGSTERAHFSTDIGRAITALFLVPESATGTTTADNMLKAWRSFADCYHETLSYLRAEYHRRHDFADYIQVTPHLTAAMTASIFQGFHEAATFLVRGEEYLAKITTAHTDPTQWGDLEQVPEIARVEFFQTLWDVPGAAPVLTTLAQQWRLHGWTALDTLMDTSQFPVECFKEKKDTLQLYVNRALSPQNNEQAIAVTLPELN